MSDLTQRMLHIRQIPVGAMLPAPVVRVIAAHLHERTFAPGERLMRRGEPIDGLHMLLHGGVRLVRDETSLGELDAPQTLGFLGILAKTDGPYDATAKGEVTAYELETDTLLELLEDHFELFSATLRYLAERTSSDMQELPQEALGIPPIEMGKVPGRPLDVIERVMFLQKSSGLAQASINALAIMSRQMEERRVEAGTPLWKIGDPSDQVLFIVEGTVRCEAADGRTFRYGPGTGAGGIEALADRPRWYGVTAETDLVGLVGRTDNLLDLFENHHRMGIDFIAMLAKAQIGLVARRAAMGQAAMPTRDVTRLRGVKVGA
ncbi:MAG: cyclic nucleotide-binding domain-containing protein [Deltaproteobacteria bacterium]|nr:cyclic nucleotide-binding domain-containing protein [Deltaproteobacteria bacterium]